MEVWVVRYDFERRPPQQSLDSIDCRFKREFFLISAHLVKKMWFY